MAVLAVAQKRTGTPNFQVSHGNLKPGAELRVFPNGLQPLGSNIRQLPPTGVSKVGKRSTRRTPYPAANLVQLGQSHAVCVLNNQGVYIGNIHPGLYNGGAHQNIQLGV